MGDLFMRSENKVLEAEKRLNDILWWNRHKVLEHKCEETGKYPPKDIWDEALENVKRIEEEIPKEELMLSDFDWGMVNGKLSAIRWFLGDEWDELST